MAYLSVKKYYAPEKDEDLWMLLTLAYDAAHAFLPRKAGHAWMRNWQSHGPFTHLRAIENQH